MTVLDPIKYQWDIIGGQLSVDYGDIKSAKHEETYDATRKLAEILQRWIDQENCEVSWRKIHSVVVDPPVKNKRVANEICDFLAKPDIMNEYLPSDQPGKIKIIKIL